MFGKSAIVFWGGILFVFFLALSASTVSAQVPMASFISDRSGDDEVHLGVRQWRN